MSLRTVLLWSVVLSPLASVIQAATPYKPDLVQGGNRWTITAYDDSSSTHQQWATQGLCFYYAGTRGSHQLYYWVSDTYPDWNGRAAQEGDQVVMHGDYGSDFGHDGMQWELTTVSKRDEGFGHWQEWREDRRYGSTVGFLNTKLTRVGQCRIVSFQEARDSYMSLEVKAAADGSAVTSPMGLSDKQFEVLLEADRQFEASVK